MENVSRAGAVAFVLRECV